jgi:signal transduction histidine kinase
MTASETIHLKRPPFADAPFPVIPASIAEKWQVIVDTLAELTRVPAGLIMRIRGDNLEVMVSSRTAGNPYHSGESECYIGSGLYCETVIRTRAELIVPNALLDDDWKDNPDVPRNMISYLGLPILWPDKTPFGTICILDKAGNGYQDVYRRLIQQFRDILEHHLQLLYTDSERQHAFALHQERQETALRLSEGRLQSLRDDLARASRLSSIGELAGSIIHEVNQPLTAIVTNAQACLRWLNRDAPNVAEARDAVSDILESGKRAADIVAGLRAMARRAPGRVTEIDIHEAIREVLELLKSEIARDGVVLTTDLQPGSGLVMGDKVQLQQVLHNLLRNGLDAMAETSDRGRSIAVTVDRTNSDQIQVSVQDNGCGIAPSDMQKLFDPLYTTKAEGMGMGLSICRSVVEAHGGRLWPESGFLMERFSVSRCPKPMPRRHQSLIKSCPARTEKRPLLRLYIFEILTPWIFYAWNINYVGRFYFNPPLRTKEYDYGREAAGLSPAISAWPGATNPCDGKNDQLRGHTGHARDSRRRVRPDGRAPGKSGQPAPTQSRLSSVEPQFSSTGPKLSSTKTVPGNRDLSWPIQRLS